mmetsp:Transcript_403/g.1617  ORF Transcript_403/g.1617 Transcript_403/m.1617 type:complete len:298 (+) Transcript_403:304-1197(+)
MPGVVLWVRPADVTQFEDAHPAEHGLRGPARELARVVLELRGQHSAPLRLHLLPPVHAGDPWVKLVERPEHGGHLLALGLHGAVDVAPHAHVVGVPEGPRLVHVALSARLGLRGEGRLLTEVHGLGALGSLQDLQGKDGVDHGGLLAQLVLAVDRVLLRVDRVGGGLAHGRLVDHRAWSLVQVDHPVLLLHQNIPRVDRPRRAHQGRQHGVRGVHRRLAFLPVVRGGVLGEDGVLGRGDVWGKVRDLPSQRPLVLRGHPLVRLVVEGQAAALLQGGSLADLVRELVQRRQPGRSTLA